MGRFQISRLKQVLRQSIQARLSLALSLLSLLIATVAGGIAFVESYRESHQLQDDLLRQVANYINPQQVPSTPPKSENDARVYVQTPTSPRDGKHYIKLPETISPGLHTLKNDGDTYRVYIKHSAGGRIAVMQDNEFREDMAIAAAWRSALPLLLLIPLINGLTIWIIRRAFRPLRQVSAQVRQRRETDLTPLPIQHVPTEVNGFVHAINQLFERTETVIQQQQRFIGDAAHEMRTPMTALSVQAERLANAQLPEPVYSQLRALQQGIKRNRNLLEQLLSLARAQASELQRPRNEIHSQQLFRRVIEALMPLSEQKNIDIGVTDHENHVFYANETDVYTLIKTLADNAIRYTPPNSQIDLFCEENPRWLILQVEDNGVGIPLAERARVLDPFYRLLGTAEQGTGLGLAIANSIVKHYGGHLELSDSIHFEHGLLVKVFLDKQLLQA